MKIFFLTVFSFAVLAVTLADLKIPDTPSLDIPDQLKNDAVETKSKQDNDLGIDESLEDILNDDDEDDENHVYIPSLDQLTTNSDPIELGEEIKNVTDPDKRKELITQLKKAWNDNRDTLPGKFYQAALASLKDQEKAATFWNNQLQKETNKVLKSSTDYVKDGITGVGNAIGKARADAGNVIDNARTLVRIDPLGIALRRGDSILLTVLSDASKNLGKISDLVYDTAGNVVGINRKVTARLQGVPFVGEIKDNVDDFVDERLKRGKLIVGSFANTGAETFATLAKDSDKKADEKQELFRQFTAKSTQK